MDKPKHKLAPEARGPSLSEQLMHGNVFSENCPSREILNRVTSRWGLLLLVALQHGTHRFSDLRRKVGGISERMLAHTLQGLEGDGFVARKAYPVVPPHVEYSLTPLGCEIAVKVQSLADWLQTNLGPIVEAQHRHAEATPGRKRSATQWTVVPQESE